MLEAILQNLGTILVSSIVIAILALAVSYLLNRKKNGQGGCGGLCSQCSASCGMREEEEQTSEKQ